MSGLSKSVAAGLRVGFIAAPDAWLPAMERVIRSSTWNTPAVMSAIACMWMEDGTVAALEQAKREDARVRQALARRVLADLPVVAHPSSYFLWIPLAEEARADQIAMSLQRQQVAVTTAEPFATTSQVPHATGWRWARWTWRCWRTRWRRSGERCRRIEEGIGIEQRGFQRAFHHGQHSCPRLASRGEARHRQPQRRAVVGRRAQPRWKYTSAPPMRLANRPRR